MLPDASRFEGAGGRAEEQRLEDKYSFACGKATSAIASGKSQIEAKRAKFRREDEADPERSKRDPRCKMERNMYHLLARKYATSAASYRDARVVFDKAVRNKLTRQVRAFGRGGVGAIPFHLN